MTTITESPAFQRLEAEGRLLKPALNGPTHVPGRFGFRGEIALTLEPPVMLEAAIATVDDAGSTLSFLAGSLSGYKHLPALVRGATGVSSSGCARGSARQSARRPAGLCTVADCHTHSHWRQRRLGV